jgi:hypothetical protein
MHLDNDTTFLRQSEETDIYDMKDMNYIIK